MVRREPGDRTIPTLITLIVLGILLMTFDVRLQGGGALGVVRSGTQTLLAPIQKGASFVMSPITGVIDSLSNVTRLREENAVLRRELTEAHAALVAIQDQLARLELFESLYRLERTGIEIGRTVANVIGRPPDAFDQALIIDRGASHGIAPGQPVVDTSGYVVGTVREVTRTTALVVPLTAGPEGVTVLVGDQVGRLLPQIGSPEMRLEILDARSPVQADDQVLTSAASINFPAGYQVGVVVEDASPSQDLLTATVRLSSPDPETLRVVVVLAWPSDPVSAREEDPVPEQTTTTTTIDGTTTTTEDGG